MRRGNVTAGAGGALPGLRQRLESEMRLLRSHPEMPHTIRPTIRPILTSDVCALGVLPSPTPEHHGAWCLSAAEAAAWYAVARLACEQAAGTARGRSTARVSISWTTPVALA